MNERIKELAEQAEKLADEETKAFTDNTGQWQVMWNEVYDKKFAELIVRECADRIDDLISCDDDGNQILDCDNVKTELLEHFGVE
jgi:hypothetical protein